MKQLFIPILLCFSSLLFAQQNSDSVYTKLENHYKKNEYNEALTLALQCAKQSKNTDADSMYGYSLNYLVLIYVALGRYEQAETVALDAVAFAQKKYGKENPRYVTTINSLAGLYMNQNKYEQAEPLYNETLLLTEKLQGKTHENYASSLNNLAFFYKNTGKFSKAEPLYLEALALREKLLGIEHPAYSQSLNNLAGLYRSMNQFALAESRYLQAIALRKKVLGESHADYANSLSNAAMLYADMGDYDKSEKLHLQATDIYAKALGKEHPNYARSLNNLSGIYIKKSKLDTAFQYALLALAANSPDSIGNNWAKLADYRYYNNEYSNSSLEYLIEIRKNQYLSGLQPEKLGDYYQICKAAMQLNERFRNDFTGENNKLRSLAASQRFVLEGIEAAVKMGKDEHFWEAFGFAEQNKSVLLADALKGQKARVMGDLPDSLVQKELALQQKLDKLKKQQAEASETEKPTLAAPLNDLNAEIERFKRNLKNKYPKYHQLKYENITASAQEIQALLDEKTLFLEYVISQKQVYLFALSKKAMQLYTLPTSSDSLKSRIKDLRKALSDYNFIRSQPEEAYSLFADNAHWFYKNMIAQAIENKDFSHLIIVCDGELGHLPFETFLRQPAPTNTASYAQLDYLLNHYNISYNYSATLWKENRLLAPKQNNGKILAAAANYDSNNLNEQRPEQLRLLRGDLPDLPSAKSEVAGLSELFAGNFWQDTASSERHFKQSASHYNVIHLAMHGILDKRYPILSSLAFTEDGDSLEDNFLQAYEISQLQLNANLVVLSACETGYGRFQQGEGVMSLARSFMYAGVPSLVVSLWEVNDVSTSQLMQDFYNNLAAGMDKSEALRRAKIQYISNAKGTGAHPAYWSPFIQLGDNKAIEIEKKAGGHTFLWTLVGILGAVLLLFSRGFITKHQ